MAGEIKSRLKFFFFCAIIGSVATAKRNAEYGEIRV